ncbi:MAG: GTP cyclohydrolase I FolE [Fibrobacteraceae bacterium]|nr:GTP cyclohydrolase I FolE [Fibrobacteraceae bacterium]
MDLKKMEDGFRMILEGMGEDLNREGLVGTPRRVAKMYAEMMSGLTGENHAEDLLGTCFHEKYDEMIVIPTIDFASMCEHHFLPFIGKAYIAYIPGDCIVGLSKIPRVVEYFARFPQIQERMTRQIAETIQKKLNPKGVAVLLEASHMCTTIRGIKKPGVTMITTQLLGRFKTDEKTRAEFMAAIGKRNNV